MNRSSDFSLYFLICVSMAHSHDAEGLVVGGDGQERSFLVISFDGR